jgi:ATP synthase protein I
VNSSSNSIVVKAAIPTVVIGVVAAVVASFLRGSSGLVGAILGSVIVVIFFAAGQLILEAVMKRNPTVAMSVAMLMYLVKIGILFILLLAFKNTKAFDTKVFAMTILVCTLVWTAAEVWAFGSAKVLYVEPGSGPDITPGR